MPHSGIKKIKIVATLGPSSSSKEIIRRLAEEGVNVFRINLSHSRLEESVALVKKIRSVERTFVRPIAILADLVGPKIRIGAVAPNIVLQPEQKIKIVSRKVEGDAERISLNFPTVLRHLKPGAEIYLGDGLITLTVEKKIPEGVIATVLAGGTLLSRMGFSAHGLAVKKFSLTAKDRADIKGMASAGVDALAVSFVQSEKDIESVRVLLPKNKKTMLIAKIETLAGVERAEAILDAADGLMVARGDLGFSIPMAELPFVQKELIALALKKAKPVITATQMLESMIHNHLPTRAEVTDVAKAILDGTDAVMLSAETAIGKFPVQVIKTTVKIIKAAIHRIATRDFPENSSVTDAICASTVKIADRIGARLVIVFTLTGDTAMRIARHRHQQPIVALSPDSATAHRLNFSWGISPEYMVMKKNLNGIIAAAKKVAANNRVLKLSKGELFVICTGIPFTRAGAANLVLVQKV